MPRIRGGEVRQRSGERRAAVVPARRVGFALVLAMLALAVLGGLSFRPGRARGEELVESQESLGPTAAQTKEFLESGRAEKFVEGPRTDLQAAQSMPHRDLEAGEALELAEAVFEPVIEAAGGIYGEIEPEKFLSDNAALVPVSSLPTGPGPAEGLAAERPDLPVLVESALPLRAEDPAGEEEPVDLGLERSEGELQPANPLVEVAIPAQLGEGISLPGAEVGISVAGAPEDLQPTDAHGEFAFYPETAKNTDLIVAPTPQGLETMTDIRSAEAPMRTSYELSLPAGAELRPTKEGGAEVVEGGRTTLLVPPPMATDAAGDPVEVELTVSREDLEVQTTPDISTVFPVLVDPTYVTEGWWWTIKHESMAAWSGNTTNQNAMNAFPDERWNPTWYPGLDLSSFAGANIASGTQANWEYWVPRYKEDLSRYGEAPSTWIYNMTSEGVLFLPWGSTANYPALVVGLVDRYSGWNNTKVHYGGEGEMNSWTNIYGFTNENSVSHESDKQVKGADMNLVTYQNETPSTFRDTYMADAVIAVVDEDAPEFLSLKSPEKWMNETEVAIPYEAQDKGLGLRYGHVGWEGVDHSGWGLDTGCAGTAINPCPRRTTQAQFRFHYNPAELPTGEDQLTVTIGDPMWGSLGLASHTVTGTVTVKVDHTAPELSLSGPLTEQEKLGIEQAEYPLTIHATDGTAADPQSGVGEVQVKVDGKLKSFWHPGCSTQNCSFSGTWTLKSSEYSSGQHEVEVVAVDAVGKVTTETLEVELGEAPPQTSFTSPHPSHETQEVKAISFKATRNGAPVEGATFRCSLDGAPATACTSPYPLPEHLGDKGHTFTVAAVDKAGKADPTPATWHFETTPYPAAPQPNEKMVIPETGKQTASYYTLEAEWGSNPEGKAGEGVTGVTFQIQLPGKKSEVINGKSVEVAAHPFETVPAECVIDGQGRQVSWPLPVHTHPGHNAPVYLRVRGCPLFEHADYPEKEIQFRAVFDGSDAVTGASAPTTTEFVYRVNANRVATDATEQVGPASVDLATGAFTMSRTDVSIPVPGYEANLEFTRTYSSTIDRGLPGYSMILGGAWQPGSPLESESHGEAWSRIVRQDIPEERAVFEDECWVEDEEAEEGWRPVSCSNPEHCQSGELCEEWEVSPFQPHEEWIELLDTEGAAVVFEIAGENYIAPEYAKELKLTKQEGDFVLAYPNGSRNVFVPGGTDEWRPKYVSFQATPSSMRLVYDNEFGHAMKLVREIAPAPAPIECEFLGEGSTSGSEYHQGCRTLKFEYAEFPIPMHFFGAQEKLIGISYYGPSGSGVGAKVAEYTYKLSKTSEYPIYGGVGYEQEEMLVGERDPRLPIAAEAFSYSEQPAYGNLLSTCTPPGQEPWVFGYEYGSPAGWPHHGPPSRLKSVARGGMTTTLAYNVPTHGASAPYALGSEDIARWGQTDLPVDATAIFPANHVPSEYPPHEYTGATIHYMDPEGHEVNTASPSPPGVAGASIATTETDMKGNVVRELSPRNRLLALESAESAAVSHQLDTHSVYNANGTELLESWGPIHQVRVEATGETVQAREHTTIGYDEGAPPPPAGTPPAYLPTKETVAAVAQGKEGELEPRTTLTRYEWAHRLPEEVVVDPGEGGLNIRTITKYNSAGQVIEARQPKGAAGGTAGDTRTVYYSPSANPDFPGCGGNAQYANLPCGILPAAQASGTGRKQLQAKWFLAYDNLDEPTNIREYPQNAPAEYRRTESEYDQAGRLKWTRITGGGTELARTEARTETDYSPTTGAPTEQKFVCEGPNCAGFDDQATTTTYNSLGQVSRYEDADGAVTETGYDAFGRPVSVKDPRGTETLHYDESSGVVTSMEVSGVGTFTATYDADGNLIDRDLPDGLTANTTYNVADEPTKLTYTKTSSCGSSCTWYEESLERSIEGRILSDTSSLVKNRYRYDKDGRLVEAQETPTGGQCAGRAYTYDKDSNRLTKTTRTGVGGACPTSGGTTQSYGYDEADRLEGPTYDAWGRITGLPAEFAGGKALTTRYFANDMVATQGQSGVTNTFQLDATGRQRRREQAGGVAGIEIFHYDGPGDSPSWTSLGSTWTRDVLGIGGELAAVQESTGTTTFKLTDLHGDVVASASSDPTATELLATSRFTEFGEPVSGGSGRFGWLGGKSRRTELSSGVIQMGARSYIPQLGRFLTLDPVRGGSANAYDYANQDPVNVFDLDGECIYGKKHPHCIATQSPKQLTRTANKERVIRLHFRSKGAAERFARGATAAIERWARLAGRWKEKEVREAHAAATKAAHREAVFGPPPSPPPASSENNDCAIGTSAAGTAIFVISTAPETAGASLVIGAIGWAVGVGGTVAC